MVGAVGGSANRAEYTNHVEGHPTYADGLPNGVGGGKKSRGDACARPATRVALVSSSSVKPRPRATTYPRTANMAQVVPTAMVAVTPEGERNFHEVRHRERVRLAPRS
ncbi:MAG: hypothetical protein QM784_30790 [Polyangiaceae bacterium]